VQTNVMPPTIDDLNKIPVKFANGATVFMKDVAQVRDRLGSAAKHRTRRWNAVGPAQHHQEWQRLDARSRQSGQAGAADGAGFRAGRPQDTELFDQSVFVARSVEESCVKARLPQRSPP